MSKNHARGAGAQTEIKAAEDEGFEVAKSAPTTTTAIAPVVDPDFFESVGEGLAKPEGQAAKTPWIGLFGEKTKNGRDALVAAGVEVNQFYLHDEAGPLKIKPFQYHLLRANRYYTKQDQAGRVVAATRENPYAKDPNTKFKEHLMALVVVTYKTPTGAINLVPATWGLRSGVVKAMRLAINLVLPGDAKSPPGAAYDKEAWAARSPAHAISAQARFPGGRFVTTAWGTTEITEANEDGETFDYNLGHCTTAPTSIEGVLAFNKLMSDDFVTRIVPAVASWEFRCKQIEKMIAK